MTAKGKQQQRVSKRGSFREGGPLAHLKTEEARVPRAGLAGGTGSSRKKPEVQPRLRVWRVLGKTGDVRVYIRT